MRAPVSWPPAARPGAVTLVAAALAMAVLAMGGCTGGGAPDPAGGASAARGLPDHVRLGPEGDAFYRPPGAAAGAEPGDLIWARPIGSATGDPGYLLLYWSTAATGELAPVSGVLFRPPAAGGSDPAPAIVAWAEGTSGLADECAPSRAYLRGEGPSRQLAQVTLGQGGVFVASDYQGLGTPGEHPYLAQQTAGRNVLDSIRAAATLVGIESAPEAVVLGTSQGGGATLLAAELQPAYAPEIALRGVVAVAPPSQLDELDEQLDGGRYFGYVLMAIAGLVVAYPELAEAAGALTPAGRAAVDRVREMCTGAVIDEFAGDTAAPYGTAAVLDSAEFRRVLAENDPGEVVPGVPVLIVHGGRDDTIPVANTRALVDEYCRAGGPVSVEIYPDHGHVDVLPAALPEIVSFLQERLAGGPAPTGCAPD